VYPVVEPFEVDDGAVLSLLERLVRPGAVVVRHSPLLLRVRLLPTEPAAAAYVDSKP
jgi:hypothetical protein